MAQTKKQKREKVLDYWEKSLTTQGSQSSQKYRQSQIDILRVKLGLPPADKQKV